LRKWTDRRTHKETDRQTDRPRFKAPHKAWVQKALKYLSTRMLYKNMLTESHLKYDKTRACICTLTNDTHTNPRHPRRLLFESRTVSESSSGCWVGREGLTGITADGDDNVGSIVAFNRVPSARTSPEPSYAYITTPKVSHTPACQLRSHEKAVVA